jgi:hypothetical protein
MSEKDKKIETLLGMGFPEDEVKVAITICGMLTSVEILDSIHYSLLGTGTCIWATQPTFPLKMDDICLSFPSCHRLNYTLSLLNL